jgi:hypothetical protein
MSVLRRLPDVEALIERAQKMKGVAGARGGMPLRLARGLRPVRRGRFAAGEEARQLRAAVKHDSDEEDG